MSATAMRTSGLPRDFEQIRQHADAIYHARAGMMRMTLNDWLKTELELKQQFGGQTNHTNKQP